jgi:glycosyltransferase involved in cell wall biosynthesis
MSDGRDWPQICVVTPCLNQAPFIEATVRSVLLQGYPALEYVLVDGGSTDGSLDVIRRYAPHLTAWTSEADRGQSDAINKGIRMGRGEIVAWLNSDDLYEPRALEFAAAEFADHPDLVLLYGDCLNIDPQGQVFSVSHSRPYQRDRLIRHWPNYIPQPTAFFRRKAFEAVEGLDISLHYAMDYDLWIRLGAVGPAAFLPRALARFRVHPASKTGAGAVTYWPEMRRVSRRHGAELLSPMLIKLLRDRFYIFRQRLKRGLGWS